MVSLQQALSKLIQQSPIEKAAKALQLGRKEEVHDRQPYEVRDIALLHASLFSLSLISICMGLWCVLWYVRVCVCVCVQVIKNDK